MASMICLPGRDCLLYKEATVYTYPGFHAVNPLYFGEIL